jgi:hypothetical protein
MRLRVVSYILGFIIVLVIGFVYCRPAVADVVTYDVDDLYYNETKFTRFVDQNGDDWRIVYATNIETGKLHVMLYKNGEQFLNWNFETGSGGYNKSYFYVSEIVVEDGVRKGTVSWRVWKEIPKNWESYSVNKIVDGAVGEMYFPPSEEQIYEDFIKGKLIIYIPAADPYRTNKNYVSVWFNYALPHNEGEIPLLSFTGGNWVKESGKTWVKDGYIYGEFNYHVGVELGESLLSVSANYGGKVYSDSLTVIRTGFIDEDGDGWDDNTGEGWWPSPDESDWGEGVPQPPGEDATIFDYIKYLSDSLVYSMNQMLVMLRSFMGGLAQLGEVFRSFFSFMPPQFSAIILLGLIMAVILRVVSR